MRLVVATVLTLTLLKTDGAAQSRGRAERPQYLYVWAGAADSSQSDFLAVIDATPGVRYGEVFTTVPVGAVTMAHHIEMVSGRRLLANGFEAGKTFRFDLRDPRKPVLVGTLPVPDSLASGPARLHGALFSPR